MTAFWSTERVAQSDEASAVVSIRKHLGSWFRFSTHADQAFHRSVVTELAADLSEIGKTPTCPSANQVIV